MITVADIGVIKMTNKEAIEAIKCNYPPENYTRLREALDMAIEALENEKQTPKKPINLTCPTCGFDRIDNSWWVFTYCPKCGQLLDWEEE